MLWATQVNLVSNCSWMLEPSILSIICIRSVIPTVFVKSPFRKQIGKSMTYGSLLAFGIFSITFRRRLYDKILDSLLIHFGRKWRHGTKVVKLSCALLWKPFLHQKSHPGKT